MKKISVAFILCAFVTSFAQTFVRTYNFPDMTGGLALSPTSDGGFVGTGQHNNAPGGSCDIYLYRVSGCGNILWYKTYGSGGSDGGRKVIQASDGGFLTAGLWDDGGGNGYDYAIEKTDAAGNLQWITVWNNASANSSDYAHWIYQLPNGVLASGGTDGYPWANWNAVISMYNNSGAHLWTRAYGGAGEDNFPSVHFNGTAFYAGGATTSFGQGQHDLWIVKTDIAGNPLWMNAYGTTGDEGRYWDTEGVPTPDGGYIIAGHTNNATISAGGSDILVVKVDASGTLQWAKRYGGSADEFAEGIALVPSGGYAIVGTTYSYSNGDRDACLLRIDNNGNLIWAKSYGDVGCDRGVDIIAFTNNYALSMNYNNTLSACGVNGEYDPMFIKTDTVGNCGCNVVNAPFSTLDVTTNIITTNIPLSNSQLITSNLNIWNPAPTVGNPVPNENFKCIACSPVTPSISITPTIACEGQAVLLTNYTPTTSAACFEWYANGNPLGLPTSGTTTATFSPGTYNVELKATCGNTVSSASQNLIVNPKPTAAFSYTDHICVDKQPVNYINTGSTGGSYSYQWYLGAGATPTGVTTQNANNIIYSFGGGKNVSLVVTNVYGCKDSISKTLFIEPLPNMNFTATNPTCVGDTTYFTNSTWVGGSGVISSWYWDFGDATNSTLYQPNHVYSAAGTYTVMLVATSDYACDDTLYKTVDISPPTVAGNVISNQTVCAVSNNGTVNIVGNTGNVQYWEYSTDGGISWFNIANTTTSQGFINLNQTTIYRAYVKSGACPGAYTSPNATITVDPISDAGILLKDTSVCATINTGVLSLNNYTGTVSNWYFSTAPPAYSALGNTSNTYTFTNLNNTTYYYAVVQSGICPPDTSNIITVNVSPATIGGTLIPSATVCASSNGGTLTLTNFTGNVIGWEFSNDGGINWIPLSNITSSQTYSMLTTTTLYRVKVKSGVCPEQYSTIDTIKVDPVSVGGILKKDSIVCIEGNSGLLTLSNYTGSIVDWYFSSNASPWNALNNYTNTYNYINLTDTTNYIAVVKSGVCPSDTSNTVTIYVIKFNGAYTIPKDTSISLGYTVQIQAGGGNNYYWTPNYNISDTLTSNPLVWPYKDTVYSVIVTNQYGCLDTASVRIIVLKDYKLVIANTMTPNNDNINDFFWIGFIENYPNNEIIIFNRYGQVIFKGSNYDNKKVFWDGTYQGNKVPDGAYYYVIKFNDNNTVFKGSINVISSK